MPEGEPFHTFLYDEIVERLRSFTNLRVVPDNASDTAYRIDVGPFPGWKTLPPGIFFQKNLTGLATRF
jgi:hypothetical protein